MMSERDYKNILNTAMEKGFEQGRAEERLEMAKRLKALGVSEDIIAKSTGLTVEEIMNL